MTEPATSIIEPPKSQTTKLPAIRLAEAAPQSAPQTTLLPGRVDVKWILKPAYLCNLIAGVLALTFALQTYEWSASVVLTAWVILHLWTWVYGVAYRHRRMLLKFIALSGILVTGLSLSALSFERALPQEVVIAGSLATRGLQLHLVFTAIATASICVLFILHALFLGRGYRPKSVLSE